MPPPDPNLPADWDDTDHAIWEQRIRQHKPWREVGPLVGMSYEGARKRFYRRMSFVETPEIEAYRNEENEKHDLREQRLMQIWAMAMKHGDYKAGIQAIRALDGVSRTRAQLNGLNVERQLDDVSVEEAEAAIERMLDAYLQGVNDGAIAGASPEPDA